MLYEMAVAPFVEFEFMRRALVGSVALAIGAGPIGVFLMLRRMSLTGDAMAHAILPGAASPSWPGSSPAPPRCARMPRSPPSISFRWRSAS
jgi:ABC-type Mn2+/Zn2+ transport system permease subunit